MNTDKDPAMALAELIHPLPELYLSQTEKVSLQLRRTSTAELIRKHYPNPPRAVLEQAKDALAAVDVLTETTGTVWRTSPCMDNVRAARASLTSLLSATPPDLPASEGKEQAQHGICYTWATANRDMLGRRVREVWLRWVREQPNPKPSWVVEYDKPSEPDKEVDRLIGEVLFCDGVSMALGQPAATPPAPATGTQVREAVLKALKDNTACLEGHTEADRDGQCEYLAKEILAALAPHVSRATTETEKTGADTETLLSFVIAHQGTIEVGDGHLSIALNAPDGTWPDFSIDSQSGLSPEIGDFKFIANELRERCDKIRAAMSQQAQDGKGGVR
jgi:hypothetical protein